MSASHRFALNLLLPHQDDDVIPGESAAFDAQLECHISRMDSLSLRALRADPLDWDDPDAVDPFDGYADYLDVSDAAELADMSESGCLPARNRRYS